MSSKSTKEQRKWNNDLIKKLGLEEDRDLYVNKLCDSFKPIPVYGLKINRRELTPQFRVYALDVANSAYVCLFFSCSHA